MTAVQIHKNEAEVGPSSSKNQLRTSVPTTIQPTEHEKANDFFATWKELYDSFQLTDLALGGEDIDVSVKLFA